MALSADQLQQQIELYQEVIKTQQYLLGGIVAVVVTMVGVLHTGITKRLDRIDSHIDPVTRTVERHDVEITNLKSDVEEINKWVGDHDSRIQRIERHPILKT